MTNPIISNVFFELFNGLLMPGLMRLGDSGRGFLQGKNASYEAGNTLYKVRNSVSLVQIALTTIFRASQDSGFSKHPY
jgi:hypothetical protein